MKLKKYKKRTFSSYILKSAIIIIISLISSILIINYFANKVNRVIVPIAESETKKYLTQIINDSTNGIKFDGNLFTIQKSTDNEIKMINYNSYEATKLINEITNNIQNKLDIIHENYIISQIPLGVIFDNSLLRNFGPKIKVRIDLIGNIISELQTEVKPYGINNALIEVRVKINAGARVILPFTTKNIKVENIIPISINIINGSIPEAYIGTYK